MTTRKRKLSCLANQTAPAWIARLKTAMERLHFEGIRQAFSQRVDGTNGERFFLSEKIYMFISNAVPHLSTRQTIRELCEAESAFIEWDSRYNGIPSFGSILVTLGSIWGSAPGGQAIVEWNQDRKALLEAHSCIPQTLAEANVTQLIVFYVCHHQLARDKSQVMIYRVLPWLVGRLYGKTGILWMLVIAVHFQVHLTLLLCELNCWLKNALYGLAGRPSPSNHAYDLKDVLLLSDPHVVLERSVRSSMSETAQILMGALAFLPTVLIPCIVKYLQPPEWLCNMETLFEKVRLTDLEAQFKKEAEPLKYKEQALDWTAKYRTMLFRGTVDYNTLGEGESLWIEMSVPLKCSFGSILVDFVKAQMDSSGEDYARLVAITDSNDTRRQLGPTRMERDAFVPLLLAPMNLTEFLRYYVRHWDNFKIHGIHELIPRLVGDLYGIRGVFWMLFVVTRLEGEAQSSSTIVPMCLHDAMHAVVCKSVPRNLGFSTLRHSVYERRKSASQ
jgi:hypothetical protein